MDNFANIDKLIDLALKEDLDDIGDITSDSIFSNERYLFRLIAKEDGILCGIDIFKRVMALADIAITTKPYFRDGNRIENGTLVAEVSGPVGMILKAERTALNFLSILSGIATQTSHYVKKADGRLKILDTRKTIPGFRELQKYAVRCGGGNNHRMGLYDMVLIKDNHIDAAGGISAAVERVRSKWGTRYKIEVETRTLAEVKEALACNADRIMLDNMSEREMSEAVVIIGKKCETEASGNITLKKIDSVAATGVDFASAGELTNSIKALDFSLKKE